MKNIFICLFAMFFLSNCTDDKDELIIGEPNNDKENILPDEGEGIEKKLFEVINLDYKGLEKVKQYYEAGNYQLAANALLDYYRMRTDVVNPNVTLLGTTASAVELNIANQALDYRFYVRNFPETRGETDGVRDESKDIYYSFKNSDGTINWDLKVDGITDNEFKYQRHRHQWMVPQAKAYYMTKDEKYILSWKEVFTDWMKNYPCPEVIKDEYFPWSGLQIAERVSSQADLMTYYIHSANFTPEWLSIFLTQYVDQVESIRKLYKPEGNILVTQLYSLTLAGVLFPELKKAEEWVEEGTRKLNEQIKEQFNPDGIQNELDPSYHVGAISDFYNAYEVAKENNKAHYFSADYMPSLRKATEFVMDLVYPNYSVENFNDTRSGRMQKSMLIKNFTRYAQMFPDNEGMKWMATQGKEGKKPTYTLKAYEYSGYYMLRNGWDQDPSKVSMFILKNNYNPANAEGKTKWHCQADNNKFSLFHKGRNFFPDAGVYAYSGDPQRNVYEQTAWHNTITIFENNIDQMLGKFIYKGTDGNTNYIVTENAAYIQKETPKSDVLNHRRSVFHVNHNDIDNGFFVLVDELYGPEKGQKYNLNFNLCEGTKDGNVVVDNDQANNILGAHTVFQDGNNIVIRTYSENVDTKTALTAKVSNISNDHGVVSYKDRLRYLITLRKGKAETATRAITVIYPTSNPTGTTINAEFTDGGYTGKAVAIKVTVNGTPYELSYTIPENNN